jgi:Ca2+-binding RTX toxin-like protein
MERRELMTISPGLGDLGNQPHERAPDMSVGTIVYNSANGAVTVTGSDAHPDRVTITRDGKGTLSTADDSLKVYLDNIGTPKMAEFKYTDVKRVFVNTLGGNDTIDNQSAMPMTANAGLGIDILLGGLGADSLLGGDDDDYLDGRGGDDSLYGENGIDALFGDDGVDLLFGGAGQDWLFGGNGDDKLYGELGNDKLYGGAGKDTLTDSSGTNTWYTDYGPDQSVSNIGFASFDWFDRNLQDPGVRSLARLQYRDGLINRGDMLNLYTSIATNGSVSQNEINDLKDLVSTKINVQQDTRWFSTQIAMGNAANARDRGTTLGNLIAGSADRLNKLVDEWFKGGDLPAINANATYGWVAGQLFQNGVSYTDVMQGSVGDCYLLAVLGETAQHQPALIQSMFGDNGDSTYTVRFMRGNTPNYVTVNRLLPINNMNSSAEYAGWGADMQSQGANKFGWWSPGNELWVSLLEKAYAQLNEQGWTGQDGTNSYAGITGGFPADVFGQITGQSGINHEFGAESDFLALLNLGKAIVLATDVTPSDADFVGRHAYMVIGYSPITKLYTLFNPWGFTSSTGNAATNLQVAWDDLANNCSTWTSAWV